MYSFLCSFSFKFLFFMATYVDKICCSPPSHFYEMKLIKFKSQTNKQKNTILKCKEKYWDKKREF